MEYSGYALYLVKAQYCTCCHYESVRLCFIMLWNISDDKCLSLSYYAVIWHWEISCAWLYASVFWNFLCALPKTVVFNPSLPGFNWTHYSLDRDYGEARYRSPQRSCKGGVNPIPPWIKTSLGFEPCQPNIAWRSQGTGSASLVVSFTNFVRS
jgi:hypothetical protein